MRTLNNNEISEVSGGIFGFFSGLIMGSLDYNIKTTIVASSAVECLTYSLGYVSYFAPGIVFGAPHLIPVALIGAGFGYVGYELAQVLKD